MIGASASIVATALTMWWSGKHETKQNDRQEAAVLRAEKRVAYADLIRAIHAWREATVELADGERRKRDWNLYWERREESMDAGATLQLVGTHEISTRPPKPWMPSWT